MQLNTGGIVPCTARVLHLPVAHTLLALLRKFSAPEGEEGREAGITHGTGKSARKGETDGRNYVDIYTLLN